MKTTIARVKAMSLAAIALGALTASAEIKYWDNPAYKAFDVGDYVQDGLLLHYDGIRNAGAAADHDSSATVWKNLGTGGASYDMTHGGTVQSPAWMETGYSFSNDAYFRSSTKHELDEYYEIETLVDAKASDYTGIGYIYTRVFADVWHGDDTAWRSGSLALRPEWTQSSGNSGYLVFNTHFYTATRPIVPKTTSTFDYITAIGNSTSAAVFTGLDVPTSAPGYIGPNAEYSSKAWNKRNPAYFYLGGHENGTGVGETFKGTIRNFRYYSRVLTDAERTWNRLVDEARFFGRVVALPMTNVVVASNIPIAFGEEPIGCYAVNGTHIFSAPASKVIKGRTYTLNGYTVETWDGEKWGAAQEVAAGSGDSMSYTAADNALVRLTWRWTAGDGLVNYDADDYVRNGLLLNYDGIRNAGLEAPHDPAATVWKNLGSAGSQYDATLSKGEDASAWTGSGYYFGGKSKFTAKMAYRRTHTMQMYSDAMRTDQPGSKTIYYICAYPNNQFAIATYDQFMYLRTQGNGNDSGLRIEPDKTKKIGYVNSVLNSEEKYAAIFFDSQVPTSGENYKTYGIMATPSINDFSIGGQHDGEQHQKGGIKFVRYYDRVLNDDELAWNRTVDNARFFPVTNVVVATTRTGVFANEKDGAYQVSGSYTFTAPESVTVGKFTYAPVGYAVQVWDDANGVWGKATEYTGNAYAYTTSAGKVRLLWRWKVVKGIRTLADYDVTDYVAGGLTFHLDGIRNAGATAAHAEKPEIWANLGTEGGDANIREGDKERVVNWTDKGYFFDGNTRFFATLPYTTTFTLQLYTDAIQNEQHNPSSAHILPFQMGYHDFSVSVYNTKLYFRTQGEESLWSTLSLNIDKTKPWGYVTAVLDDATRSASVFSGTKYSDGASKTFETMAKPTLSGLTLGGGGSSSSQYLKGTLYYYRYYDRVLSEEELAWNREVDEARYFGALSATNVVVVAGGEGAVQAEAGAYKVDGEWTFTASKTVDASGNVIDVERYAVEELVGGVWKNRKVYSGNAYTYTKGESSPTVRLKWLGRPQSVFIIVR